MFNILSIKKNNFELVLGIITPLSFLILYYLSVFFISAYVYLFGFLFILSIILSLIIQKNIFNCFFLSFALSICLPTITHPVNLFPESMEFFSDYLFIYSDRFSLRSIGLLIISVTCFFFLTLKLISERSILLIPLFIFSFLFVLIFMHHSYEKLSIFQIIIDFGQVLSCISIIIFFRNLEPSYENKLLANSYINLIFSFLVIFILFDLLLTFSGLISWSHSYRGAIQGAFYYSELNYSLFLGIAFIFILYKLNLNNFVYILLSSIFTFILFLTQIKTTGFAFIIAIFVISLFKNKALNKLLAPIIALSLIALISFLLGAEETNSLIARFLTYYLYFWTIIDGNNLIFGIMPGIHDVTFPSNLSLYFFDAGYVELLTGFPDNIAEEYINRSTYDEGGAFLPHNTLLTVLSGYGIITLYHMFKYLYLTPYNLIKKIRSSELKEYEYLISMVVFIALCSLLHPIMQVSIIIFIIEFLNFSKKIKNC